MAKLEIGVVSEQDVRINQAVAKRWQEFCDSGVVTDMCVVSNPNRNKEIVDAYLNNGEYYDLDYPGGITQFVKDYQEDKFDEFGLECD